MKSKPQGKLYLMLFETDIKIEHPIKNGSWRSKLMGGLFEK